MIPHGQVLNSYGLNCLETPKQIFIVLTYSVGGLQQNKQLIPFPFAESANKLENVVKQSFVQKWVV
jgi:hypothetical protein